MPESSTSIEASRERLETLLADCGAEVRRVFEELEQRRRLAETLTAEAAAHDKAIEKLNRTVDGQGELIETLRTEASESSELRRELQEREVELESLKSERDSKLELIRVLRRDAEAADRLRGEVRLKDRELGELRRAKEVLEAEVERLREVADALRDAAESDTGEGAAELESMRAELEARKRLIKSLQADGERAQALEDQLEEKRQVIQSLEASINRHADTIAELKRAADSWKRKFRALKGGEDVRAATTSTELPALAPPAVSGGDVVRAFDLASERTIAIDMRRSLVEARRTAQGLPEK